MNQMFNDKSCAKLISKKSDKHLKISIIIFLLTISIVMTIGILYMRQYFQYEKDFLENIALKTICVDSALNEKTIRTIDSSDIESIEKNIKEKYPDISFEVIPVYTCIGTYMNDNHINVFAIDEHNSFFIGVQEMINDTAYFSKKQSDTIEFRINVIKEAEGGFSTDEIKSLILKSSFGVSEKTPVLSELMPSMKGELNCFVNIETFKKITSVLLGENVNNIDKKADESELITLSNIYVYVDELRFVNDLNSFLMNLNYHSYSPTNLFDNFNETISVTYSVFLLSAIILLFIATINIFLSFKSFYRVQQKDMGILRYMGFSSKRIYKMYCKNLKNKFLQIMLICSGITSLLGCFLFSFEQLKTVMWFIISLLVFLSIVYYIICKTILYRYITKDIIFLIRESKEFE